MPSKSLARSIGAASLLCLQITDLALADPPYTNFESSHVHPIALTPSHDKLLAVNTPVAVLEIFAIDGVGNLSDPPSVPVGLEPVTVKARSDTEAWVVNNLSDSISIVDLTLETTVKTTRT